jgi:cytochrome c-type biogenesis protein CcmH
MLRWIPVLLVLLASTAALAQTGEAAPAVVADSTRVLSEEEVSARSLALFVRLMSPYCPGATLRDCGSGQANVLRERIREQIRRGESDQQIVDALVVEYGETILSRPRFRGFGMVAYLAPIAALLIGIGALVLYLKRQGPARVIASEEDAAKPSPSADASALRRKLEDELRLRTGG